MKLYIGTDKSDELVYLEWEKVENEQKGYFSLSGGSYREPMTESEGDSKAKEYLEDGDSWKMAVESGNTTQGLNDWAEEVLSIDGWEHIIGDIEDFGEHKEETIYLENSSGGQHQEEIKNFKSLWVDEKDLKEVYDMWDNYHLSGLDCEMGKKGKIDQEKLNELSERMEKFFDKYKKFCSDQEALTQYLKDIDY